jgi:hypothetical protein
MEKLENKHLSEDKDAKTKLNNSKEVECGANWQLYTNGSIGSLKCRKCGVYVTNGGTPKCLKNG